MSPGFKRRSPILRGHCLPGFLRSRSQRLAQYAEREYTGKSLIHSLLTPALISCVQFIISRLFKFVLA